MRIDIGSKGEVVGTKKVTAAGHVAGLKAYAGREVLVVAPDGLAKVRRSLPDTLVALTAQSAEFVDDVKDELARARSRLDALRAPARVVEGLENMMPAPARALVTRLRVEVPKTAAKVRGRLEASWRLVRTPNTA